MYIDWGRGGTPYHGIYREGLQGGKLIQMIFFVAGEGELIRGVRDFVGLLIFASFFPGLRKHPVPGGGAILGCATGRGIFFVIPHETVVNRVYNFARHW